MVVFFLERRTAPSGTFTRTGPRSGSARRGSATLLVKFLVATVCFCGSFAYLCRTMKVRRDLFFFFVFLETKLFGGLNGGNLKNKSG